PEAFPQPLPWSPRRLGTALPGLRFGDQTTQTATTDVTFTSLAERSAEILGQYYRQVHGRQIRTPDYQRYLTEVMEGPSTFQLSLDNAKHFPALSAGDHLVFVAEGSSKYSAEMMSPYFRRLGLHVRAVSPNAYAREMDTRLPQANGL